MAAAAAIVLAEAVAVLVAMAMAVAVLAVLVAMAVAALAVLAALTVLGREGPATPRALRLEHHQVERSQKERLKVPMPAPTRRRRPVQFG